MKFPDLVPAAVPIRLQKPGLLVIMPVYTEYPVLFEHLEYLKRQTFQRFNLLIVLGDVADGKKVIAHVRKGKYKFGVIVAKRKEDTGPAGAFFAGQKYALENGYGCVVFAESDCFPVDNTLLEELHDNRGKGYVSATVRYSSDSGGVVATTAGGIAYYTLFSRGVMEKFGLYFAPLYQGSEDWEYFERIRMPRHTVPAFCVHPYSVGDKTYRKFDRYWLYVINTALFSQGRRFIYNFLRLACSIPVMLFFMPPYGRRAAMQLLPLLLTFTYGKPAAARLRSGYESSISAPDREEAYLEKSYPPLPGPLSAIRFLCTELASCFRKNVSIESSGNDFAMAFLPISARKLRYRTGNGAYLVLADNSNLAIHLARIAASAIFLLAFVPLLLALFIPVKLLRRPQTLKYGLD